jgi:antitoxin YefM
MQALQFSETRANLKNVMDRVVADHEPVIVVRRNAPPVVIMSLEDWNAMDATCHLLASPANAAALHKSIAQFDAGRTVIYEPVER